MYSRQEMGSVMETSDATPSDLLVLKSESIQDGYTSSSASTPEADIEPATQDVVQVQKRKGGRKPVHSMKVTNLVRRKLTSLSDICHLGGTQAEKPASTSCFSRTTNRIYQAAGKHHQAPRGHPAKLTAESSQRR